MITYPDGTEAREGDHVVLAHGVHSGIVLHVLETAGDLGEWNLDEPGLMIETSYAGLVFYPTNCLSPDEIEFSSRGSG